jgi:hypothetical protein
MKPRLCVFAPVESGRPLAELAGELTTRLSHAFEITVYRGRHEDEVMEWARAFPLRHATSYRADRQRLGDGARLFLLEDDAYVCEALIAPLLRFGGAAYLLSPSFNRLYQTITIYRGEPEAFVERMRLVHGPLGEQVARAIVAGQGRDEWFEQFDLIAPLARAAALTLVPSRRSQVRLCSLGRAATCLPVPVPSTPPQPPARTLLLFDAGVDRELEDFLSGLGRASRWGRLQVVAPLWRHQAVSPILARRVPTADLAEQPLLPAETYAVLVDLRRAAGFEQHQTRHRALMAGRLVALRRDADSAHLPEEIVLRAGSAIEIGQRLAQTTPEEVERRAAAARTYAEVELTFSKAADRLAYTLLGNLDRLEATSRRWERFAARESRRWRARALRTAEGRLVVQGYHFSHIRRAAEELFALGDLN